MLTIQILIILFILFVVIRLSLRLKRKELKPLSFISWLVLWLIVGVFVIWPETSAYLANLVGIGRGVDLGIYVALLIIFYLLFKIFLKLEKLDRKIVEIVRKIAINNKIDK